MQNLVTKKNILVIDGHGMLFKYFWGMPFSIKSKSGKPIHAAYGFIASLLKLITKFNPDNCYVCFDSQVKGQRHAEMEEYKANRLYDFGPNPDDSPFAQLDAIKSCLQYFKIKYFEIDGIEADDIIGSISKKLSKSDTEIIIYSNDLDFLQLVQNGISVFSTRRKNEIMFDTEKVCEFIGLFPDQIIDYKSILGDKSDNIKGVKGIGKTTAVKLLKEYKNINNLFLNFEVLAPGLKLKFSQERERVLKNQNIIKINCDINIEFGEDSSFDKKKISNSSVRTVFKELNIF